MKEEQLSSLCVSVTQIGRSSAQNPGPVDERFYEKVIKVKADAAALLNFVSDVSIDVRW
jgi:hypothetical protein